MPGRNTRSEVSPPSLRARMRAVAARPRLVIEVGLVLILVQLAYRTWALAGGWFLIDDYGFLADVTGRELTVDYLFHIHNDHLQPLGFLIVWVVGQSSPYNWALATAITIGLQALADLACLVFLVRLGGRRWAVLIPLGFYLFSVVTLPGFLWWCVAMMQVPQQLAAFSAMALHVEYLRTGRRRYVAFTGLALAFGMLCDVKVVFVAVGLAFLTLYLSDAPDLWGRLRDALWRRRLALLAYSTILFGYLALYVSLNPIEGRESPDRLGVFEVMSRYTLGPTLLGGPWQWGQMTDTPLVPAQPPEWAVTLTWVGLTLLLVGAFRRRRATLWALLPLLVGLALNVVMVSTARGAIFGKVLGLEVRYLGDLAPTLVLTIAVLAVALAPTRQPVSAPGRELAGREPGAGHVSRRGAHVGRAGAALGVLLVAGSVGGSFYSSSRYVANWHADYPARAFVQNVIRQSEKRPLNLVDDPVPLSVIPRDAVVNAFERPSQVFRPLGDRVFATLQGNDLEILDDRGLAHPVGVLAQTSSEEGPVEGCGHQVTKEGLDVPLVAADPGSPPGDFWWGSIAYLSSGDGPVTFSVGTTNSVLPAQRGLHTFVFLGSGAAPTSMHLRAGGDLVLCVDEVRIGDVIPLVGGGGV